MYNEPVQNLKGIKYKFVEYFKNPITGKRIRLSVTLNRNTKQAEKIAREMLQEKFKEKFITVKEKVNTRVQNLTFYDVAGEWLEHSKPAIKISTYGKHKEDINVLKKYIATDEKFLDITPARVKNILYDMYYERTLSHNYVLAFISVFRNIFRYAKEFEYLDDINDYTTIKLKRRARTNAELEKINNKFLTREELRECLTQLYKLRPRYALAMEFIALTGLRCGELLALKVDDYDKLNSCIHVNKTYMNNVNVKRQLLTPKNEFSYRTVMLENRAKQILDKIILENKQLAQWNSKKYHDRGFIFTSEYGFGYPCSINSINLILKKIDIPKKKLSTHIFRHTHISILAELNIPLKVIMERVGHNNPNTTLKIYTHVTENMKNELKEKLNALNF